MDAPPVAPPVVAVIVTCDPDQWFEEVLASFAAQDYPNLAVLVLDAGSSEDPTARVASVLPGAYVRRLPGNGGFSEVANQVFTTVKDAAYYVFCHDDVAPDRDALRLLVEEALRSNAGIVGPKLVDWHDPDRLLEVGLSTDKTGYVASLAERHELDQEQYDAVRDVFAVPSAMFLVRSDLFVSLKGFDPAITGDGEDLDLCWRAQVAGARVLVAPAARARHLEDGYERRLAGDDDRADLRARHRLRAVLKNYGPVHLLRVLPQAVVGAIVEVIVAVAAGRGRQARAVAAAWTWNAHRIPELRRLRRAVRGSRMLPDREVRRLQVSGSAHLTAYVRGQLVSQERVNPLTQASRSLRVSLATRAGFTTLTVLTLAALVLLGGSRHLLGGRIPAVGQLAPFPGHATALLRDYASGWRASGLGAEGSAPTAFGLLGLGGLLLLGDMSLLQRLLILGAWPLAALGVWRLTRPLGSTWARLVAVVVVLSVPLPYDALARGRWSGLVAFAAAPWILRRLLAVFGDEPFADPQTPRGARAGLSNGLVRPLLGLGLLLALASAFVPAVVVVTVVVGVGLLLGGLVTGNVAGGGRALQLAAAGAGVAIVLLFPWSLELLRSGAGWSQVGGVATSPTHALGLGALLRFHTGPLGTAPVGWAFAAAAGLPLLIGKEWRLAWAARLWMVALTCVGVAWVGGRGWLPIGLRSPEVLLSPAAVALAAAAALGVVAFQVDLPAYRFGFRQLASVLVAAGLVLATLPVLVASLDGRWHLPNTDLDRSLAWMRGERADGASRVLWVGDGDVLPLDGRRMDVGAETVGFGISRDGPPRMTDLWPGPASAGVRMAGDALRVAMRSDTTRLGHLLAPLAIRYVVVVQRAAPVKAKAPRVPAPRRLTDALKAQTDLRELPSDPDVLVYRSTAWGPVRSELAAGSDPVPEGRVSGGTDLSGARPVLRERSPVRFKGPVSGDSRVLVSEQASPGWVMRLNGESAARSRAFGWSNSFAVGSGGMAELRYRTPLWRRGAVLVQVLLWFAAVRTLLRLGRRSRRTPHLSLAPREQ